MSKVHRLSRTEARRIAVRAQLLDKKRPTDMMQVIRHLTMLQLDGTRPVAPSADLVLWSRIGSKYKPSELQVALDTHKVIDLQGMARPSEDLALYRAEMADWDNASGLKNWQRSNREWVKANDFCRRDIIRRLRASGPVTARELPDTCKKPWRSSGWNNNKNVTMLLELMVERGEVAGAGREGRERLWDLAERVYPKTPVVPAAKAARMRDERRLRALGIARSKGPECPVEPVDVNDVGEPAVIEGVAGEWRVDPKQLGQPFAGRAALLSPLDRLLFERKRMVDLFEFDYALEMYKPAPERKWGYYALPILYGDRLVGKLDATFNRKSGELRVDALHEDQPFTKAMASAVDSEIADLAKWLKANFSE